jgi:hypothetical protein
MPITKGELYSGIAEKTHRSMILNQVERCNRVISAYDTAQEIEDIKLKTRTFIRGAQEGKAIALCIRVLLSISRKALPQEFFKSLRVENKYKKAFEMQNSAFQYLSENPTTQYKAIMLIMDFYDELIAAIFSLEDFSDVKYIRENKMKTWGNNEQEDDLFISDY